MGVRKFCCSSSWGKMLLFPVSIQKSVDIVYANVFRVDNTDSFSQDLTTALNITQKYGSKDAV